MFTQSNNDKSANNIVLPFQVESIKVVNTGFGDEEVEHIKYIDEDFVELTDSVYCVYDNGMGGTISSPTTDFAWSFSEQNTFLPYVLITLKNEN